MTSNHQQEEHEAVYDGMIAPLMAQIIAICKEHGIPMVATFQLDDAEDALLCSTVIPGLSRSPWMGHLQKLVGSKVPRS